MTQKIPVNVGSWRITQNNEKMFWVIRNMFETYKLLVLMNKQQLQILEVQTNLQVMKADIKEMRGLLVRIALEQEYNESREL